MKDPQGAQCEASVSHNSLDDTGVCPCEYEHSAFSRTIGTGVYYTVGPSTTNGGKKADGR